MGKAVLRRRKGKILHKTGGSSQTITILLVEEPMVAGDTKRVIVIKNIASNLIEEAILILKNEPGAAVEGRSEATDRSRAAYKSDHILKEAESIIHQYIKENGLAVKGGRRKFRRFRLFPFRVSVNVLINCLLVAALAFLIFIVCTVI
jgi:hypothetical protein